MHPRICVVIGTAACAAALLGGTAPASVARSAGSPAPSVGTAASGVAKLGTIDLASLRGTLVFARAGGAYGDETLFTARLDGSEDRRIGGYLDGQTTCCPRWSADGEHLLIPALTADGRFTTARIGPDGSDPYLYQEPVDFSGGCLLSSASSDRCVGEAALVDTDGTYGLWSYLTSDGGDPRPVVTGVGMTIPMDMSPDGTRVLFAGTPVGPPTGVDPDAPVGSLYVVGVDGSGLARITPEGVYATSSARWSPDGEWIVGGGLARSGDPIWVVRPDGSDWHVVYEDPDGWGLGCPVWSPDGRYILFCRNPPGSVATLSAAPPNGLYVMRADGTGATPVIVSDDWKREADWTAVEWPGAGPSPSPAA